MVRFPISVERLHEISSESFHFQILLVQFLPPKVFSLVVLAPPPVPTATTEPPSIQYAHAGVHARVRADIPACTYTRPSGVTFVVSPCVLGLKRAGYHPRPVVRARKTNTRDSAPAKESEKGARREDTRTERERERERGKE